MISRQSPSSKTHSPWLRAGRAVVGLALGASMTVGCSKEPPPVAVAPPPKPKAPAPPPPPAITPVDELMAKLRIDDRVMLAEDNAPDNDKDRVAVLEFFDAFATGDHITLGAMLSLADRMELDVLREKKIWDDQISQIASIELHASTSDYGPCVFAIFETGMEFQPQLWYYQSGESGYTFDAAPTPPNILDRVSTSNPIQAWHDVWAEELARADEPDKDLEMPQVNLEEDTTDAAPSAGGGGGSPGKGPRNPGRRPPRKNPRKAPGPPGR